MQSKYKKTIHVKIMQNEIILRLLSLSLEYLHDSYKILTIQRQSDFKSFMGLLYLFFILVINTLNIWIINDACRRFVNE